jgi:four helix bundle protein
MYKRFEDLKVWQMVREFRKEIYRLTKKFPKEEQYALTNQIRRAAISITANIAEGHGRYHYGEGIQFCRTSRASISECLDHLYTALDENYIAKQEFDGMYQAGRDLERVLNGYIGYLQKQTTDA